MKHFSGHGSGRMSRTHGQLSENRYACKWVTLCSEHFFGRDFASSEMWTKLCICIRVQLILEEFGKWLNSSVKATMEERNKYFGIVYDETEIAASLPGSPLKVNNEDVFHNMLACSHSICTPHMRDFLDERLVCFTHWYNQGTKSKFWCRASGFGSGLLQARRVQPAREAARVYMASMKVMTHSS